MVKSLSQNEKQALLKRFDLSRLTSSEQAVFHRLLFDYLNEFPVLNEMARELIDTGFRSIQIKIPPRGLDGAAGTQSDNVICFDRKYWDKNTSSRNREKELASTFWHEALHYLQERKLSSGMSKRGHIVYRQFIEAEAKSISNLIRPNSLFECSLYEIAKRKFKNIEDAQKYYLGVSTRLRLYADRSLAMQEAKNIMGSSFNERHWRESEDSVISHWRDFYYGYHADHIKDKTYKGGFLSKFITDRSVIRKIEDYFFNKYGIKILPKASISQEVLEKYDMTQGIENTILFDTSDNGVFDFSKWQRVSTGEGKKAYILELPNMDKNYVLSLQGSLLSKGVSAYKEFANHSDGRVNWCLVVLDDGSKNANRFLSLCGVRRDKEIESEVETERVLPPMPPHPQKQVHLKKGMVTEINPYNPPILKVGKDKTIAFDLQSILNKKRIDFLRSGGIMLLGRNPASRHAKIPLEVQNYSGKVKGYLINNADGTVSNAQGYIYMARDGKVYYKDCSTFGTHLFLRSEKLMNQRLSCER